MAAKNEDKTIVTDIYACSDVGNSRTNNEDNFIIVDLRHGGCCPSPRAIERRLKDNRLLLAVSDGMGGAQAGEIAAALSVYGLRLELLKQLAAISTTKPDISKLLMRALEHINTLIWHAAQQTPEYRGMGATMTAVIIEQGQAYVAEVGDSRAYLVRRGKIKQLTTDQSLYEALMQSGAYRGREPEDPASRNIILQSLGGQERLSVAVTTIPLRAGDQLLLCSDGLSNKLTTDEIRKFVSKAPNLETACASMVGVAKKRGGEDNITMVLACFDGNGLPIAGDRASITGAMEIVSSFNPLGEDAEKKRGRMTQQMVSDAMSEEDDVPRPIYRSTIGMLPSAEYPQRKKALSTATKSVKLLTDSSHQIESMINEFQQLDQWLIEQGRLDPTIQKAIIHLEFAVKNVQKIEAVARKAQSLMEQATAKLQRIETAISEEE